MDDDRRWKDEISLTIMDQFTICLDLQIEMDGCYLPSMSTLAHHVLEIGGPTCMYTLEVTVVDDDRAEPGGIYFTTMLRREINNIIRQVRGKRTPGWSRNNRESTTGVLA